MAYQFKKLATEISINKEDYEETIFTLIVSYYVSLLRLHIYW